MPFVRLDSRLTVGIDANQVAFRDSRQHEELEHGPQRAFLDLGNDNLCRSAEGLRVGLIGSLACGIEKFVDGLTGVFIQSIVIGIPVGDAKRHKPLFGRPEVGKELVPAAFLMLLTARVQIAGVDDCQRCSSLAIFAKAFRKKLIIP